MSEDPSTAEVLDVVDEAFQRVDWALDVVPGLRHASDGAVHAELVEAQECIAAAWQNLSRALVALRNAVIPGRSW